MAIWFWIGIIALCMVSDALYKAPIPSVILIAFGLVALFAA